MLDKFSTDTTHNSIQGMHQTAKIDELKIVGQIVLPKDRQKKIKIKGCSLVEFVFGISVGKNNRPRWNSSPQPPESSTQ